MKKTFSFTKKQEKALERFNKAFKVLEKAGVALVVTADDNIKAVALSKAQKSAIDSHSPYESLDGLTDVTDNFLVSARDTELTAYFPWEDTVYTLPK